MPSFPWNVESSNIFEKNQKIFKIPKMPIIVPKSMQTCFEHVLGQTFRKNFAQFSMECRVFENFQKNISSKFQKCPKVFPKVSKRVLNMFCGKFFEKFYAQCSMEGRVLENFLENQKILKIQKCPKSFPKVCKHVLNLFWVKFFEFFCPVFRGGSSFRKFSKKIFSKFQKCPKVFPKESKRVLG